MVKKKDILPTEGDLVIVTVNKVYSHGAFGSLDEYQNKEGYIHISEVASTWIKNIRDFVKEGQKTVAKVLSVNPHKEQIDISLRRVSEAAKKNKIQDWKRLQKAHKLLEITAKSLGKDIDAAYEEVGFSLGDKYGEIYGALEEISALGREAFEDMDIPEEWIEPLIKISQENVTIPVVEINGYVDIKCPSPDGVEAIKNALVSAEKQNEDPDIEVKIRYVGSPRYRINVVAPDYKQAEGALKLTAENAIDVIKKYGGTGNFMREIKEENA